MRGIKFRWNNGVHIYLKDNGERYAKIIVITEMHGIIFRFIMRIVVLTAGAKMAWAAYPITFRTFAFPLVCGMEKMKL